MSTSTTKVILVIGGTGAQGGAVIDALLKPSSDGSPSYSARVLTRNTSSPRAQALAKRGVEVLQGSVEDFPSVLAAMEGAYGAYVNTDSLTLGEDKEVYIGMRLFELAKQVRTLKHYVWSSLDYSLKKGGFNPVYRSEHRDGKARVADWMRAQSSTVSDSDMSWGILTTMVYMDMLKMPVLGPVHKRHDGTYVFAAPMGNGHVPLMTLSDIGFFARYIFDNRETTSAQELEVASDWVDWHYLVRTFTEVTGKPAVYVPLTVDEWIGLWHQDELDKPFTTGRRLSDGPATWREFYSAWWLPFQEDIIQRNFAWIRRTNPGGHTLGSWMKEVGYTGDLERAPVKRAEEGGMPRLNLERTSRL